MRLTELCLTDDLVIVEELETRNIIIMKENSKTRDII